MKIGDKVKIMASSSGPEGNYVGSTPFKDEIVIVTEKNANAVEGLLRAGHAVLFQESERKVVIYRDEDNAPVDVLPDSPPVRARGRKRVIQPEGDQDV